MHDNNLNNNQNDLNKNTMSGNFDAQLVSGQVSNEVNSVSMQSQNKMPSNIQDVSSINSLSNSTSVPSQNQNTSSNNGNKLNDLKNKIIKLDKKILFIAGGCILFLIILVIVIANFFKSSKHVSPVFDPKTPILIKEDGKYGYISNNGKVIIQPNYTWTSSFYGDYAVVKSSDDNSEQPYKLIDRKGNIKASAKYNSDIKYLAEYGVWIINNKLFNKDIKLITDEGVTVDYIGDGYFSWKNEAKLTAGIMNYKGKVTYKYKKKHENDIVNFDVSKNYGLVKETYCTFNFEDGSTKAEKAGIVNCNTGKVVYESSENNVIEEDFNVFTIVNRKKSDNVSMVYVKGNKIVYKVTGRDKEIEYYGDNILVIEDESKDYSNRYSYYNLKTKKVSKEKPSIEQLSTSKLFLFNNGVKEFTCNSGKGLMKKDKIVLSCEWEDIDYFSDEVSNYLESKGKKLIMAEKGGKSYLINAKNMKVVQEFNSSSIYDDSESIFVTATDKTSEQKIVYNLLTGNIVTLSKDSKIYLGGNYFEVENNNKIDYYNTKMKLIYTVNNK